MGLTQTHEALELWVEILTIAGPICAAIGTFAVRGWIKAEGLEKDAVYKRINDMDKTIEKNVAESHNVWEKQWQRVDELRAQSLTFVTRDRHDNTIKDLYMAIEKAVEAGTRPLSDAINKLGEKFDRWTEKK